jgi:hypothetical protein
MKTERSKYEKKKAAEPINPVILSSRHSEK